MENKNGFTLIEIVFYIAIMTILIFVSFLVLNIIGQSESKNRIVSEVEYQGLRYVNLISQEIRNSIAVDYLTDNSLILRVNDPIKNPIVFTFSEGNIYLKEGSQEKNKLNNSKVSIVPIFLKNNSVSSEYDSIGLSLKVFYNNGEGRLGSDYSKIFNVTASTRQKK
jgi:type II secretory pathway pseudopilin PulG